MLSPEFKKAIKNKIPKDKHTDMSNPKYKYFIS